MSSDLFDIEGFEELQHVIDELGQVPRKVARASARAGGQKDLVAVKNEAPVYDGWLKAALEKSEEKSSKDGKASFDIRFNKSYNVKLVKTSSTGKRSYYPNSQEYGWSLRNGGYHPGLHYMEKTSDENSDIVKEAMVDKALSAIDKILESR